MDDENITRVLITRVSPDLLRVQQWAERWVDGADTAPDVDQTIRQRRIETLLIQLEKSGFACWMPEQDKTGHALRGEITRIDFLQIGREFHVRRFPYGWTAKTPAVSDSIMSEADWLAEIERYAENDLWKVRRWPLGARAFLGKEKPVRDRASIKYMRSAAEDTRRRGDDLQLNKCQFDFAYDF